MLIRSIRALLRRPPADRVLLLHAIALHAAIALLYRAVRFGWLTRALTRLYTEPTAVAIAGAADESRVMWAVTRAASLSPFGSTCLTAALTAQCLLRRLGREAVLRFGVRPPAEPALTAHAWLEWQGRIVFDHSATRDYLTLG